MSIQPVSFNAMSYNYPVARYNSQPIQNPSFRGIEEEEQQPKKKSHTGWWVAAGLAVAGIATYLLTRGKAKGAVEKVVKNAENTVNKAAEGTKTAENTAEGAVEKVVKNAENTVNKAAEGVNSTEKAAEGAVEKVVKETPDKIMKRNNDVAHNARAQELEKTSNDTDNIRELKKRNLKAEIKQLGKNLSKLKFVNRCRINNVEGEIDKIQSIRTKRSKYEAIIEKFKAGTDQYKKNPENIDEFIKAKKALRDLLDNEGEIKMSWLCGYVRGQQAAMEAIKRVSNEMASKVEEYSKL